MQKIPGFETAYCAVSEPRVLYYDCLLDCQGLVPYVRALFRGAPKFIQKSNLNHWLDSIIIDVITITEAA